MFDSAFLKVERAQKHINELEAAFTLFRDTHKQSFPIHYEPDIDTYSIGVSFGAPIPSDLAIILGDILHNLRSALDHATWELIGHDGGEQHDRTSFPFHGTQADYETACHGIKTPRTDTKIFFTRLAAHPGGLGEQFYFLHRLNIVDKHKVLTPVAGLVEIPGIEAIGPDGQSVMRMEYCRFGIGANGYAPIFGVVGPGHIIKLDPDHKPSIDIFFGDVEGFNHRPLVETLMDLSYAVQDVLGQFLELVEGRKWC